MRQDIGQTRGKTHLKKKSHKSHHHHRAIKSSSNIQHGFRKRGPHAQVLYTSAHGNSKNET